MKRSKTKVKKQTKRYDLDEKIIIRYHAKLISSQHIDSIVKNDLYYQRKSYISWENLKSLYCDRVLMELSVLWCSLPVAVNKCRLLFIQSSFWHWVGGQYILRQFVFVGKSAFFMTVVCLQLVYHIHDLFSAKLQNAMLFLLVFNTMHWDKPFCRKF